VNNVSDSRCVQIGREGEPCPGCFGLLQDPFSLNQEHQIDPPPNHTHWAELVSISVMVVQNSECFYCVNLKFVLKCFYLPFCYRSL